MLGRLRNKPPREVVAAVIRRLAERADTASLEFPLLGEDVADSGGVALRAARRPTGRPRVGWLVVPPGSGSGGHTTLFRMVRAAADAGFECSLLFYDRWHGDLQHNIRTVRTWWPDLNDVAIVPVGTRIAGFDAVVASSWATAHVLAARGQDAMARLYFVQDYEPYFHPRGGTYALAEDSYRFGFRTIALGEMVRTNLEREVGIRADLVPFGVDTRTYHRLPNSGPRSGVAFYARSRNDRRGQSLALRALALFHSMHPDEPIHVYGDRIVDPPFPVIQHGSLPPARLNELYNSVVGGLALSFTNISLVAEELLAAGAVPVVNDGWMPRADLENPHVAWSLATPSALASALGSITTRPDRDSNADAVAASVRGRSWSTAADGVVRILRDELGSG